MSGPNHSGARRVAIVHDWFQGFHGSERTVEAMLTDVFGGEADLFTFHAARELLPDHMARAIKQESRIASLPLIRQRGHDPGRWRWLLAYMPRYFDRLDLSAYDIVVSSSHANAVRVNTRPDALHVCYCYTPMRYAWLPDTEEGRVSGLQARALRAMRDRLRRLDLEASRRPAGYMAISSAVRDRIRTFYDRDSDLVFPPVDVADFRPAVKQPGHFLWVHRMVGYKHPETVMEAFRGSPHRLTMVGVGPLAEGLRERLPPNVTMHGWLERDELSRLYAEAAGFIHVGEEDFGITMVEALAAGTPVIALSRGGAADIVRDGVDGVLVDAPTPAEVRAAVDRMADLEFDPAALAARAQEFSRENFARRFRESLEGFAAQATVATTSKR